MELVFCELRQVTLATRQERQNFRGNLLITENQLSSIEMWYAVVRLINNCKRQTSAQWECHIKFPENLVFFILACAS